MDKDKEELEREKALAHENGKEPFDFLKFISIYVHDTGTFERLKPDEPESVHRAACFHSASEQKADRKRSGKEMESKPVQILTTNR